MCRSGLCTSTPEGGVMSAPATVPGPCLRRYITTGSSFSEETTSSLMFRMISVTSSLTPGTVENSCSTPSIRMEVTAAPGLGGPAAVVCLRGDALDRTDLKAGGLQGADRGLAARAGALDQHVDPLHAVLLRPARTWPPRRQRAAPRRT